MKSLFLKDIKAMPTSTLIDIFNSSQLAEINYLDDNKVPINGVTICNDNLAELVLTHLESTQKPIESETTYSVTASAIEFEDNTQGAPTEFTFLITSEEISEESEYESILNIAEEKISSQTGQCFNSFDLTYQKHSPLNMSNLY